jgi:outer membrane biosynthesis protein TonB
MFTNSIFRIAFTVSVVAHMALVAPHSFSFFKKDIKPSHEMVELNYIIIKSPDLATEEEVYIPEAMGGEEARVDSEEVIQSETSALELYSPEVKEKTSSEEPNKYSEKDKKQALLTYYNIIREKIRTQLHSHALGHGFSDITLLFVVSPDGKIRTLDSQHSASDPQAKRTFLRRVRGAQPFPHFPAELGPDPIKFSLTVQFSE